jgi:hypothetical protein
MTFWAQLHQAIQQTILRQIPAIQTCEVYPIIRTSLIAPAVLLELSSFEPGTDPGTGEIALRAHFEARIIVDSTITDAQLTVRAIASEVARIVHRNSWGLEISPAEVLNINPDGFKPELDAYLVWVIEWVHEVHQGDSIWVASEVIPHSILIEPHSNIN